MMQLGVLLIVSGLVGIDQLTKWLSIQFLRRSDPVSVINGFFSLTYTENRGAAWSMFEGQRWLLIGVTSAMLLTLLLVLLSGRFRRHRMATFGGILVIAGGVGNLIDRVFRGFVVDFLQTDFIDFPIFNVADCFVVIGAVLLFVYFVFFYSETDSKRAKAPKEVAAQDVSDDTSDILDDGDKA